MSTKRRLDSVALAIFDWAPLIGSITMIILLALLWWLSRPSALTVISECARPAL